MWRVGIDVGGTFTDLFAVEEARGEIRTAKVLTVKHHPVEGVLRSLEQAAIQPADVRDLVHGSTTATNALIERKLPRAAMITTNGFRDTIEIGRQRRERLYDPYQRKERPLIPRRLRFTVDERISARGEVVRPLDEREARDTISRAQQAGVQTIAVCFLNAYVNGDHERRVRDLAREIAPEIQVAISTETRPQFRELGRFATTVVRAVLLPVIGGYLGELERDLAAHGFAGSLLVIKSNGGTMGASLARERPEELIESGPAGGVAYACALSRQLGGHRKIIHTDMGGTSFDVSIVEEGEGLITHSREIWWDMPIITPTLDIRSIGAGGGSIAWIDAGGSLRVGPQSAGSDPGPACYGRGGKEATVTDANLLLGRLEPTLGGKLELDREAAERAVGAIGGRVGLDTLAAAEGIAAICTENMAQAIRLILADRGRDPRDFTLASFGGAGGMHACWIARSIGIPTVLVSAYAGVASAHGATRMSLRYDLEKFYYVPLAEAEPATIEEMYRELERQGRAILERERVTMTSVRTKRSALMRYVGQSYEVLTPIPERIGFGLAPIAEAFHKAHLAEYGVASDEFPIAFVSLALALFGAPPAPLIRGTDPVRDEPGGERIDPYKGRRKVVFDGQLVDTSIFDARWLKTDQHVEGPAVLEHEHSCTVLPPGSRAVVDPDHNLLITV